MTKKGLKDRRIFHAISCLYYSWCNLYERPYPDQAIVDKVNQLVTDDIVLNNIDGTIKGKEKFIQRVFIVKKWSTATHTRSIKIKKIEGSSVFFVAETIYQAIWPDFSCNEYDVRFHFEATFQPESPKIKSLRVETLENLKTRKFNDSYGNSRSLAFMHRWLWLMNTETRPKEEFRELLADNFSIMINGKDQIDTWDSLMAWIRRTSFSYKNPGKTPPGFHAAELSNDDIKVKFELEMEPADVSNENKLIIPTAHDWQMSNNPVHQFPRIKTMNIWEMVDE